MLNVQKNKHSMYQLVLTVLTKYATLIAAIPAFAAAVTAFQNLVDDIGSRMEKLSGGTSSATKAKHKAEDDMVETVVPLVHTLHAYASVQKDVELMAKTDISETDIHTVREAERATHAEALVALVEGYKADLADYGITDETFAAAHQAVAAFTASLKNRGSVKTEMTGGHDALFSLFDQADAMLKGTLDKFMSNFRKKNSDFFLEYLAARVIKDVSASHLTSGNGSTATTAPQQQPAAN